MFKDFKFTSGKIYREGTWFPTRDDIGTWKRLSDWCASNIGMCSVEWEFFDNRFYFKTDEDRLAFTLAFVDYLV